MSATCYEDLRPHWGHNIICVAYGEDDDSIAVECETCCTVLMSFDKEEQA